MVMGECLSYSSLQADLKVYLQLGLRIGSHMALTDFRSVDQSELSHMAIAIDDSTINIVKVLFCKCSFAVKVKLFRSFCLTFYDIALWSVYKLGS